MKPFTKEELITTSSILLAILLITAINLRVALRRARDAQRRSDLGAISNALNKFQQDFGFFPPSEDGKIKACKSDMFDKTVAQFINSKFDSEIFIANALKTCEWGEDKLTDMGMFADEENFYITLIPQDPKENKGLNYLYLSNGKRFQIYSYLEGEESEEGYNEEIIKRDLECGIQNCSFGKSFADTPVDISIEEYERQLLELENTRTM